MGEVNKMYGYEIRQPYKSEAGYFKQNPNVSGMATKDGRITLNPFSNLNEQQKGSVVKNEAVRLFLRETKINPTFEVTDEQRSRFVGTPYEKDETALRHTILGRILSGDNSIGSPTQEQLEWARSIQQGLDSRQ